MSDQRFDYTIFGAGGPLHVTTGAMRNPLYGAFVAAGPAALVDGDGRVHGLQALRVVDASIMPRITTGNLNAPTIMMAEKLADAIRGRDTEWDPKPWYQSPDWQNRQR